MTMFANDRQERETIAGLKEELKARTKEVATLVKRNAELRDVLQQIRFRSIEKDDMGLEFSATFTYVVMDQIGRLLK